MKNLYEQSLEQSASGGAAGAAPTVGWHGAEAQSQSLHVITLTSSTAPLPLQAPKAPELAGLAVFRSRRVEDGRERFRLHIGYFPSVAAAEQLLPVVRTLYPAAFVSPAPQTNLGSLDDTAIARFSILRPIEAPAAESPPTTEPVIGPVPELAAANDAAEEPSAPTLTAADAVVAAPSVEPSPPVEAPPPVATRAPEHKPTQRYAVQLIWTKESIDLGKVPNLAIFDGYLLYAVETEPGGRRMYGVRLGFYEDALSARLVAQYVRSDFKGVSVVPVSGREVTRASSAAIRLSGNRPGRGNTTSKVRWPRTAVPVDVTSVPRAPAVASL